MKIALVNLCKTEDFAKHERYEESLNYLKEENIDYLDFASGADTIEKMVESFNKALDSDADLLWVIRGGLECIQTLDKINWEKIKNSNKTFWGLSDFTHFSTMAVSKGAKCFYGQGFPKIKLYFPKKEEREFILQFLKTGNPVSEDANALYLAENDLDISKEKLIGGHLTLFTFMQSQLNIDLKNRFLYLEYHHSAIGEDLDDLNYYIDQLLYIIKDNMPKGFILGNTDLRNIDGKKFGIEEINKSLIEKLKKYNLPIYYLDHFINTITFS